jgi:hypothetical protein
MRLFIRKFEQKKLILEQHVSGEGYNTLIKLKAVVRYYQNERCQVSECAFIPINNLFNLYLLVFEFRTQLLLLICYLLCKGTPLPKI